MTEGRAIAVVATIGMDTELGNISRLVGEALDSTPPLQKRLDLLGGRLGWVALGSGAAVAVAGVLVGRPLRAHAAGRQAFDGFLLAQIQDHDAPEFQVMRLKQTQKRIDLTLSINQALRQQDSFAGTLFQADA